MGKPWFRPKYTGYGATPNTRQGWAVTGGYVLALGLGREGLRYFWHEHARVPFIVFAALMTVAFCVLVYKKTDGSWRWRLSGEPK